jgi:kumamolisin
VAFTSLSVAEPVDAVLRLQETVSMKQLAQNVTDPASPRYRQFYTPEEIRAVAGPSDAAYARLIGKLKADGATIVRESPTHLFIAIRADRSYLSKIDQLVRSPLVARSASPLARVSSVNGLVSGPKRHPHVHVLDGRSHDFQGFGPSDIRKAYGLDTVYQTVPNATGQHIAIATYMGYYVDDVNQYYQNNSISPAPQVDTVSFNGTAQYDMESAAETQVDAELSGMIAPGASIHVFTSAQNSDAGELAMFTAILDDNRAKVVNYSWGSCEDQLQDSHKTDMDKVFDRAVAQGVNIFVASGDTGSDCDGDGSNAADFPAISPDVIAVGGTTLTISGTSASEAGWSGSGGGISKKYAKPDYQSGLDASKYTGRAYPDVAFNADPNSGEPVWIHYDPTGLSTPTSASSQVIGGTSIASPQWAGFIALVGAARDGKAGVGFLNPTLYAIGANSQGSYFNDITSGNNGLFTAAAGWDAVTGWGSMKAAELLQYLSNI